MAFEWLAPILTPTALATVQRDPTLLAILLAVIIGLAVQITLCWFISYKTGKNNGTYTPPKLPFKNWRKGKGWMKMGGK